MTTTELRRLDLPSEFDVYRDEILQGQRATRAFVYPSGQPIPHTSYYRLLRTTAAKVAGRPMSQEMFRAHVLGRGAA